MFRKESRSCAEAFPARRAEDRFTATARRLTGGLALVSAVGLGGPAAALTYAAAQASANGDLANTSQDSGVGGPVSAAMTREGTTANGGYSRGAAYAFADVGTLKVSTISSNTNPALVRNSVASNAYATARWTDQITISGGPTGTFGYFTANMNVDGGGGADISPFIAPTDQAQVGLQLGISGSGMTGVVGSGGYTSSGTFSLPVTVIPIKIAIVFGYYTDIAYYVDAFAHSSFFTDVGGTGGYAQGVADFSHTINWGGITGVFDAAGNEFESYTVTSGSGFDYTKNLGATAGVPEPATWAIMTLGFGLAGGAVRRRRHGVARIA